MNADAEKALTEICDQYVNDPSEYCMENAIKKAIQWAYADAASICRELSPAVPAICAHSCAIAIEERIAKIKAEFEKLRDRM